MALSNNVKEYVRSEFEAVREMKTRERNKLLIGKVEKKFGVIITSDDIYEICVRIDRMKEKIQEINDSVEDKKPYEVVDGHYIFHRKDDAPFRFSVEEIDAMFFDFSKHGNNWSGERMLQEYKLKPEAWQTIKSRLRLYKDSNVISPYTAENTPEEELDRKIDYATARHIDTIKGKMVKTHDKQFKDEAKKALKTIGNIEYFLENLRTYISDHKPIEVRYEKPAPKNSERIEIAFSDIHIGKQNTDDIIRRFDEIYSYIVSRPETDINIICLGDLGESFAPGGMHEGQVEHMEMHGFELMMFIVETFEKFLIGLDKAGKNVTFRGIGGNHDRFGKTHGEDMQRTAALAIYEMIKRGISRTGISLEYFVEKIITFSDGGLHYVLHHGDEGFDRRKPEDILWKNGVFGKHNVILHGDKHNARLQETKHATMIQVPALAGKGEYDTRLDLHSEPGFVVIEENRFGTADITFMRLG